MHKHSHENNLPEGGKPQKHVSDAALLSYLEGSLEENESRAVQQHLNACEQCLGLVASVHRESLTLDNEKDISEAIKGATIDIEDQLLRLRAKGLIKSESHQINEKPVRNNTKQIATIKELKKRYFEPDGRRTFGYWFRPYAFAASLLFVVFLGYNGFRYYETGYQVKRVASFLLNDQSIYIEYARPSGGYSSSGISITLGNEISTLDFNESRLIKAIKNGDKSIEAKQLLAQIYVFQKKYGMADSVYRKLLNESAISASLLNDMGALSFRREKWDNATKYFQDAIETDNSFLEARYNLALTKIKTGDIDSAIAILEEYKNLETNQNWRDAALRLIEKYKSTEE